MKLTIKDSFRLDHTSIRLLFDSTLITLDVFHDESTGRSGTEVRRVDRFHFELTDVMNWDNDDLNENQPKLLIVQMVGISKLYQMPVYDWDFVDRFQDLLIKKTQDLNSQYKNDLPPIEHYFLSFDEFKANQETDDSDDEDGVVATCFKGKIEEKFTLRYSDSGIYTLFKVVET